MWSPDWMFLGDWLTALHCDGDLDRQGLILNGDSVSETLRGRGPALLTMLGAAPVAGAYHEHAADENICVRLEAPSGAAYGTTNSMGSYAYDAWGNWCPQHFRFDVLASSGTGVGNRAFVEVGTAEVTNYAQIVNEDNGAGNFRTVLDGASYHHLALRGTEECAATEENVVGAIKNELAAALEWIFDGDIPTLCEDFCSAATDAPDAPVIGAPFVTRLHPGAPNPFHPRTTLRFSLAKVGPVSLEIFDAGGRKVRTLRNGEHGAGLHEATWDGTDDQGRILPAGVYWSQLTTDDYRSSKKLVRLK
jgi:hypothetical protein